MLKTKLAYGSCSFGAKGDNAFFYFNDFENNHFEIGTKPEKVDFFTVEGIATFVTLDESIHTHGFEFETKNHKVCLFFRGEELNNVIDIRVSTIEDDSCVTEELFSENENLMDEVLILKSLEDAVNVCSEVLLFQPVLVA